ncbi:hypothetical protein ALT1545_60073 [Alteromonas macleodii]
MKAYDISISNTLIVRGDIKSRIICFKKSIVILRCTLVKVIKLTLNWEKIHENFNYLDFSAVGITDSECSSR